jgi:hypothetical protein
MPEAGFEPADYSTKWQRIFSTKNQRIFTGVKHFSTLVGIKFKIKLEKHLP